MPKSDQGVTHDRYTIIPRTLIFLTCGDRVLLIKGASNKRLWADRYNGIGGHIEPGEGVRSAALRELEEETGLIPEDLWLCGTVTIDTGTTPGIGLFIFRGECPNGTLCPSPEDPGMASCQRSGAKSIGRRPVYPPPEGLISGKYDPPFSALYTYNQDDRLVIDFET